MLIYRVMWLLLVFKYFFNNNFNSNCSFRKVFISVIHNFKRDKMNKIIMSLMLILFLLIAGCGETSVVDDSQSTEQGVKQIVDANNQFAFELYKEKYTIKYKKIISSSL